MLSEECPGYSGYAQYENSNLVSRNYSIRTYCTNSNSNLENRTYCPKPPISQGIMVPPSDRLPSVRYSPRGSSTEGKARHPNVCFMRKLIVA